MDLFQASLSDRARAHGVAVSTNGKYRVRACTHLDITAALRQRIITLAGDKSLVTRLERYFPSPE
jgi:hypothetical protein